MGAKTGIEWCDSTWNPLEGCSPVSPGCKNCYASATAGRFGGPGQHYAGLVRINAAGETTDEWNGQVRFIEKHLLDPLKWVFVIMHAPGCHGERSRGRRTCSCPRRPRRIFVNSMSDLFHENVPFEWIDQIFAVMAICHWHVFQVLTKRPERMFAYFQRSLLCGDISFAAARIIEKKWPRPHRMPHGFRWSTEEPGACRVSGGAGEYWPLPNVWLGVSAENQKTADERIPLLLKVPAARRFISAEPLLGPVNLGFGCADGLPVFRTMKGGCPVRSGLTGEWVGDMPDGWYRHHGNIHPWLDWVICGGESGPNARPMHPDWARSLRDQSKAAGAAFFFKQWGEWAQWEPKFPADRAVHIAIDGATGDYCSGPGIVERSGKSAYAETTPIVRMGKHAAGSLLDELDWKQFPNTGLFAWMNGQEVADVHQ